jgi:hypothetical protein
MWRQLPKGLDDQVPFFIVGDVDNNSGLGALNKRQWQEALFFLPSTQT